MDMLLRQISKSIETYEYVAKANLEICDLDPGSANNLKFRRTLFLDHLDPYGTHISEEQ